MFNNDRAPLVVEVATAARDKLHVKHKRRQVGSIWTEIVNVISREAKSALKHLVAKTLSTVLEQSF